MSHAFSQLTRCPQIGLNRLHSAGERDAADHQDQSGDHGRTGQVLALVTPPSGAQHLTGIGERALRRAKELAEPGVVRAGQFKDEPQANETSGGIPRNVMLAWRPVPSINGRRRCPRGFV